MWEKTIRREWSSAFGGRGLIKREFDLSGSPEGISEEGGGRRGKLLGAPENGGGKGNISEDYLDYRGVGGFGGGCS